MTVGKYHSTENPYEVVSAVYGHNSLHAIAELVTDMRVVDGVAQVFDYTVGREQAVTSVTYVIKDPRGFRVMDVDEFVELYGEALGPREVKRWENARPKKKPVYSGKVTFENTATISYHEVVYGDTDEEMVADAVRKGREVFGAEASLKVSLVGARCSVNHCATRTDKKFYTTASIRRMD